MIDPNRAPRTSVPRRTRWGAGLQPAGSQDASPRLLDEKQWQDFARRHGLTPRELDIARLVWEGQTRWTIAHRLGLSVHTVRTHLEHIYSKMGVHCQTRFCVRIIESVIEGGGEDGQP